jgi:opacity protein-like surface antigen
MEVRSSRALRVLLVLAVSTPAAAQYVGTSPGTQSSEPATSSTALSQDLSVYPKSGQTREQQSADLYQCYGWAKGQTGFDPTQVNGGVAPDAVVARRDQYRRALTACLEARGYDVRYTPPPPPPAPRAALPYPPPPYALSGAPAGGWGTAPELRYHPLAVQIEGGYTATAGTTSNDLNGGGNIGAGLTWFPTSELPVGVRVDGSYSWFWPRRSFLEANDLSFGHENIYGGDADLQLDLAHRSSTAKLYLFGGVGEYREWIDFKQVSLVTQSGCFGYFCGPAQFLAVTAIDRSTSEWNFSWNAGMGAEFALGDRASFFLEARYLRIQAHGGDIQLVPVRVGLRF